ncbi:hypothetical protein BVG16_14005 [Paenibacillus selenitireducens]|uniref:HPt domain-containing protein n=1 Tax=Paenibacillus selenitireducens TaxID=1324314 RepID=A0A1T2XCB6_9BACL|nr:hypothetical protein [Paenibacillus selenitireducens]OPA77557.1 hypothetical protein BVG16_14005 [Paenibacillus selenitireducens]
MPLPSYVNEYVHGYTDEFDQQIQVIQAELLNLDLCQNQDAGIQMLVQATHTLYECSKSMGYKPLVHLTYGMGEILEYMRKGQIAVDTALTSILYHATDYLLLLRHTWLVGPIDSISIQPLFVLFEHIRQHNWISDELDVGRFTEQLGSKVK